MKPIRICSIINGTGGEGGAERMLQRVIRHGNTPEFEHLVLSIKNFQQVAEELTAEGINVQSLNVQADYYKLPKAVSNWRLAFVNSNRTSFSRGCTWLTFSAASPAIWPPREPP